MLLDKYMRIAMRPRWQKNRVNCFTGSLFLSKIKLVDILEEFWQIEEFRNQLSDVAHILFRSRLPSFSNGIEQSVSVIKCTALSVLVFSQIENFCSICKCTWSLR